ncbi:MAG: response regulator [Kordiimonadaceae bacterium]|nr:response regulator [Kordiimonadaceae bacterium]
MQLSEIKILIVDDDEADRSDLTNVLQRRIPGVSVEPAVGYEDALLKITISQYDCVLIDFNLQGKNGLELLRDIRKHKGYEFCALIVITGKGNEEIAVEAMKGSAHDYLLKDQILKPTLIQSIETACTKAKLAEFQHKQLEVRKNFAEMAAQELAAPLSTINGFLVMIEKELENSSDDLKSYISVARKNAEYMDTLVCSLLSYAHTGASDEPTQQISLEHALNCAQDLIRGDIIASGAKINHGDLPVVLGQLDELVQLFRNLLSNAVKYRSKAPLTIDIEASVVKDIWHISVRDNGIGLPAELSASVFEPLQRAHSNGASGHGLGLAISSKIVQSLGGRIWCEPTEGQGCNFVFTLPVIEEKPRRKI